ncbi:MAG: GEVED domain-containing protein [Saprospiraceae bacterium]
MKPLFKTALALLVSLLPLASFSQDIGCRLGGEKEYIELLKRSMDTLRQMEGAFRRVYDAKNTTLVNLPVQFHVVRSATGQTDVTNSTLERAVVVLNEYFANAGLRFFQCASVKYIDDNTLRNFFISQQSALVARSYVANVVNIYCVPTIEGGGVGGYTYLPGSRQPDLIVMDDGLLTSTTLTHEMGHFFGLLHTHGMANCGNVLPATDELVDGSNCSTAGDLVCDTPADPGLLGIGCAQYQVDASCNYTGLALDARGQPFSPDVRNIMSYSRSSCRSRLSPGQYSRINATYLRFRTYLACKDSVGPVVAGTAFLSMESPHLLQPNPVKADMPFSVSVQLKNTGSGGFKGKIRMVLFSKLDQQLGIIGTTTLADTLRPAAVTTMLPFSNAGLKLGTDTYKIGVYFQTDSLQPFQLAGSEKFNALFSFTVEGAPLTCVPASNVRATETGLSHVIFSWDPSPVSGAFYKIAYRERDKTSWVELSNWGANRVIILNRKPCTAYEFRLKTVCSSGETDWSPTVSATTTGCNDAYCASYGNSMRTFIEEVGIGAQRNTSGNNYGYGNYTQIRTEVRPGSSETVRLVPGMASGEILRTVFWRVWADFNRDGDFSDAGEQVFQGSEQNNRPVSATIQIPAGTLSGDIRMRVSVDTRELPLPCAVNDFREVEDYTLVVTGAAALTISTGLLEFSNTASQKSLTLESSGAWTASPSAAWLSVQPGSGGGGSAQVSVACTANPTLQTRTGTVVFQSGSLRQELTVSQSGALVTASVLTYPHTGGTQSFQVNAEAACNILKKPDWVNISLGTVESGQSSQQLLVTCMPNPQEAQKTDTLKISWPNGQTAAVLIQQASNTPPSSWAMAPTPAKHLVILSDRLTGDLDGHALALGDYIGIFYTDGAQERCAGASVWSGQNSLMTVGGDNPLTPQKDGMAAGEVFQVRVWKLSNQMEYRVNARYANAVANGIPSHTNRFAANGVSRLENVSTAAVFTFSLSLAQGFNMISFPVVPESPNPFDVFAPAGTAVREIQDANGARANFFSRLNELGSLNPQKGYFAYMERAATVDIRGSKILPSANPIVLEAGWHILPFWSLTPRPVAEALASLNGSLDLVKDMQGNAYSAMYGFNSLGNLTPGKSYWAHLSRRDTLIFPDAYMQATSNGLAATEEPQRARTTQFSLSPVQNPMVNSTIVLHAKGVEHLLEPGDEVGVFSPAGRLHGSAVFRGKNLALSVWDMPEGTPYVFRIWKKSTGAAQPAVPLFKKNSRATFSRLGLSELDGLELAPEAMEPEALTADWQVYPNPVPGNLLTLERKSATPATAVLIHPQGGILKQWAVNGGTREELVLPNLAPGLYYLQISDKAGIQRKPIIVHQ